MLQNITFDTSGCLSIGSFAFAGCRMVKEICLPDGMTCIREGLFRECLSLETVSLPSSLTSVDTNAFFECIRLRELDLSGCTLEHVGSHAFFKLPSCKRVLINEETARHLEPGYVYTEPEVRLVIT